MSKCLRNDPTCDCTPLSVGDRIAFYCITHKEDVEGVVISHDLGHTYNARADCGVAKVSTTQVTLLDN